MVVARSVDSVVRVSQPIISLEFTQATPAYKLKNAHVYVHMYTDTNQDKGTDKVRFKSKNQKQLLQTVLTSGSIQLSGKRVPESCVPLRSGDVI